MKAYHVLKIQCEKRAKICDLVRLITNNGIIHHRVFFELSGTSVGQATAQAIGGLAEFYHSFETGDFNNNTAEVYSNLDENWHWANPQNTRSLEADELQRLIRFADRASLLQYGDILLGFDAIEWEEGHVVRGTYGYQKAQSLFAAGYNYLSNSIIIAKDNATKRIECYLACESEYRAAPKLQKMFASLGKLVREEVYYAPEDAQERQEWKMKYAKAEKLYKGAMDNLTHVYASIPYTQSGRNREIDVYSRIQNERANPLNTRRIASDTLVGHGWMRSKSDISGIAFEKKRSDGSRLLVSVDSRHHGHLLYTLLTYESPIFSFTENMKLFHFHEPVTEEESAYYFCNLLYALEHVEKSLVSM